MGTKTIHTLAWKLLVDNDQFLKGTKANKKEIADAKREMRAMLSPAEKMEISLEKLGTLARKDARFQHLYNRKLAQYNTHLKDSAKNARKFKTAGRAMKTGLTSLKIAATALVGGSLLRGMQDWVDRVDAVAKAARQAGTSVEFLSEMQFAAGQMVGLSADETTEAITQMTRRIGEAVNGMGEAKTTLEAFGISVDQFRGKSPEQVFEILRDNLQGVVNAQDAAVVGGRLFGESLAPFIQLVTDADNAVDGLRQQAVDLGAGLTNLDTDKAEEISNSMGEINANFQAFSSSFMTGFGPALNQVLMELTTILDNLRPSKSGGSGKNVVNRNTTAGDALAAVTRMYGSNAQAVQQLDPSKLRGFWQVFSVMDQVKSERMNRERESINATLTTAKQSVEQTQLMRAMINQQQNAINNRTFADLN
jgi:hypothetical protein